MPQYVSDSNAEVIGQNVLGFLQNTRAEDIRPYLEKYGLTDIEPERWYPLNTWLNVLSDISERSEAMFDFVSIGLSLSETSVLPPGRGNMTFEELLSIFPEVYQMQHRNGDVGSLEVENLGDKHVRLYIDTPYPTDLDYGVIYGYARRLLPQGTSFVIQYDSAFERTPGHAVIDISWE